MGGEAGRLGTTEGVRWNEFMQEWAAANGVLLTDGQAGGVGWSGAVVWESIDKLSKFLSVGGRRGGGAQSGCVCLFPPSFIKELGRHSRGLPFA